MPKSARGLPEDFALDLPDNEPVMIGDFLEEEPQLPLPRPKSAVPMKVVQQLRPEVLKSERVGDEEHSLPIRPAARASNAPTIIRYQLNLSPRSKTMLDEIVEHVRAYGQEPNVRVSEVFQGIVGLLHGAMDELDLSGLPRRGAWGSVTAKNFPAALSEAFGDAILRTAKK